MLIKLKERVRDVYLKSLTFISLGILSAMGSSISLADMPDPNQIFIRQIAYNGSGCPLGTVAGNLASDRQAFTLIFNSFIAEAGPGIPLSAGRKNCRLLVDLHFPQGWQYSIMTVDYRGYAQLDPGSWGMQRSFYYFQGSLRQAPLRTRITGPFNDDYMIRDRLGLESVIWSPCGASRAVNIDSSVQVSARRGAQALMTIDSIDGEVRHIYGIQWRQCPF